MPTQKTCPGCSAVFECCSDGPGCWCAELPPVMPLEPGAQCLCPTCLEKMIAEKLKIDLP